VHSANLFAEIDDGVVDAGRGAIGREERGLRHDLAQSFLVGLPIGAEVKATATANARMPAWLFMSAFSGLTFPLHRPRNRVQDFCFTGTRPRNPADISVCFIRVRRQRLPLSRFIV
jgi:hypothetical protein